MADAQNVFSGAKLLLFLGADILLLRRDHSAGIPWPECLDFPGGGREGNESPQACVLRETQEETGLQIDPLALRFVHLRGRAPKADWFFAAHLPSDAQHDVRFGGEGAGWETMTPAKAASHPLMIPHFAQILKRYLIENEKAGSRGLDAPMLPASDA
jgi:8-oxo-dGTP diphosphatase